MNQTDSCLLRLFRAASRVPTALPMEASYALELRILGDWRRGLETEPSVLALPVLRRAFLCACAILVISVVLTIQVLRENPSPTDELGTMDSAIQLTLMQ
jgi:hypothetical protein